MLRSASVSLLGYICPKSAPFHMHLRFTLAFCSLFLIQHSEAQQLLRLNLDKRCIFNKENPDEELYAFRTEAQDVPMLVADILRTAGEDTQNFTLVQSNVDNVTAVVNDNVRYLLWSPDFWETADTLLRYAAFAHEIGHHLAKHSLTPALKHIEEQEADFFMGYILSMKNFPFRQVQKQLPDFFTKSSGEYDRAGALSAGYDRARKSLEVSALAFENDPDWNRFQKAEFPFPPPPCFQFVALSRKESFTACRTLGDVANSIGQAFGQKGYPYRFLSVPNETGKPEGFAVVTQLEQYEVDGHIFRDPAYRWQELPPAQNFSLTLDYLKSLVFPRKAYLRLFVVLVTQQSYAASGEQVPKDIAKSWVSRGLNRLPKTVAQKPFSEGYSVDVLVYEFEVPETNHCPTQHCPCHLDARAHLRATRLDAWLK